MGEKVASRDRKIDGEDDMSDLQVLAVLVLCFLFYDAGKTDK